VILSLPVSTASGRAEAKNERSSARVGPAEQLSGPKLRRGRAHAAMPVSSVTSPGPTELVTDFWAAAYAAIDT
jgi:hypothetical protein